MRNQDLRRLRERLGATQAEFGEFIGVSRTYLARTEQVLEEVPESIIQSVEEAFGVSRTDLDSIQFPVLAKVAHRSAYASYCTEHGLLGHRSSTAEAKVLEQQHRRGHFKQWLILRKKRLDSE